jgi:hypothetical protein
MQLQHCSSYAGVEVQLQLKGWLRHQLLPDYFKPYYLPGQSDLDIFADEKMQSTIGITHIVLKMSAGQHIKKMLIGLCITTLESMMSVKLTNYAFNYV